jgi:hypothetical protein
MKVTLHKALRIRSAVEEKVKTFDVKPGVALDVDSAAVRADVAKVIADARDGVHARLDTFRALNGVLSRLRVAIAEANVSVGVEHLLAAQGTVDREIAKIKALVEAPRTDTGSLSNKIDRKIEALKLPQQGYGRSDNDTLSVNVLSAEDVTLFTARLVELRRTKERLEDERAAINHRSDIEIGDDDANVLTEHGII